MVEAFAWPATRFADEPTVAGIRPILARVLPGWAADESSFVPMADPAAVLAEALVVLLEAMAPSGAVVTFDDLHWADPDTLSVLVSLVDSVDQLPVALVVAARDEPQLSIPVDRLGTTTGQRLPPRRYGVWSASRVGFRGPAGAVTVRSWLGPAMNITVDYRPRPGSANTSWRSQCSISVRVLVWTCTPDRRSGAAWTDQTGEVFTRRMGPQPEQVADWIASLPPRNTRPFANSQPQPSSAG